MGLNVKKITFFKTNFLSRFSKNKEGSTAIEFALLILPFSALLFAIIETAVVFFISSTLGHALSETSRPIRVGDFQRDCSDTPERFKAAMCENMISIGSCENQLSVDLVASADGKFNINLLPPLPPEDPPLQAVMLSLPGLGFTIGWFYRVILHSLRIVTGIYAS